LRGWRKRWERVQTIGRSRGGRTTKIHALTDAFCRPIAFLLTGGQVADCIPADTLLEAMPTTNILHGDKGYDSNAVRTTIESKGTAPHRIFPEPVLDTIKGLAALATKPLKNGSVSEST